MLISRKRVWKEIRDWGLLLALLGLLFASGAHIYLQRAILYTGWFNPKPTPNTQMPPASYDLLLQDAQGNLFSLGELKSKVVFLNFWATWCPPCVAEMPGIQAAYEQTHSDKVVFVMISLDEDPARAEHFIQKNGYTFPLYFLAGQVPSAYEGNSIPRTYVISPEGQIASQQTGMGNYGNPGFKKFLRALGQP
ncbi:MAG: hypothetical protein OHK0053_19680 [Microscillaceae bacterium]